MWLQNEVSKLGTWKDAKPAFPMVPTCALVGIQSNNAIWEQGM